MSKQIFSAITIGLLAIALSIFAYNCGSDDGNFEFDSSCTVAKDCCQGDAACEATALADWKCYNSICILNSLFCTEDAQCVSGECVNNSCGAQGRITDNPNAGGDYDVDRNVGDTDRQIPCAYECCSDNDCAKDAQGNPTQVCVLNECYNIEECASGLECCMSWQCWEDAEDKENLVCYQNMCRPKDNLCPDEFTCCENQDCAGYGEDFICVENDCINNTIECNVGHLICCDEDFGNPDCNALGALKDEKTIECIDTDQDGIGDDWQIVDMSEVSNGRQCPEYHNCEFCVISDQNPCQEMHCGYNGRCEFDEGDNADDWDTALARCQQIEITDPEAPAPPTLVCMSDKRVGRDGLMICSAAAQLGETCAVWQQNADTGAMEITSSLRCFPESLHCDDDNENSSNVCVQ